MAGGPDNPHDEAPAAWALWQWMVARIAAEEVVEFGRLMTGYRDEIRAGAASESAIRELTLPQAMALHSLAGRIIDQAQRDRWTAAGRCGVCGFDGDRAGCQDCVGGKL